MLKGITDFSAAAPPHNLDAEAIVLGALLYDNDVFDAIAGYVTASSFYSEVHARIFEAAEQLIARNRPADPSTLRSVFGDETVDGVPVRDYLSALIFRRPAVKGVEHYARVVRDNALLRNLMDLGRDLLERAPMPENRTLPERLVNYAEAELFAMASPRVRTQAVTLAQAMELAVSRAALAYQQGSRVIGLETGLPSLDKLIGGLQPGNLMILAARPSMGKTALAVNMGFRVASTGKPVAMVSLEMSEAEIGQRILADASHVPSNAIRTGSFDEHEMRALMRAQERHADTPFLIDDTGGLSMPALAMRARRWVRQHKIDLLLVDYLQLLQNPGSSRYEKITEISMGLKALAKELHIPVIALSQLSRENEKRGKGDRRPQLSDLRESGAIEQDADLVLFVHREEYYLAREEPDPMDLEAHAEWKSNMEKVRGRADLILAKNRHGETGIARVNFDQRLLRFYEGGQA